MVWLEWLRDLPVNAGPWVEAAKIAFAAIGLLFSIIFYPLYKLFRRLVDIAKSLRKQKEAAEAASDEEPEPPAAGASTENWERLRTKWSDARERVEQAIVNLHGNARRKYGDMARFNYRRIAEALHKDNAISLEGAAALRELDQLALSRRRARAATDEEAARADQLYKVLRKELPSSS